MLYSEHAFKNVWSTLLQVSCNYYVYVCDLGVAKLQQQSDAIKTSKGPGAGTIPYKAPEMFTDNKRTLKVDMHSSFESVAETNKWTLLLLDCSG